MEKMYDGELNQYHEVAEPTVRYKKQLYWNLSLGLQKVDGLTPSKYMEKFKDKSIHGELDNETLEIMLKKYYESQDNEKEEIQNEKECDLVSARIVRLLEADDFKFSIDFIKHIHEYLFKDIYEFNGVFRKVNIIKPEPILNGDTVIYSSYETIEKSLEYDLSLEKNKNYDEMNILDVIDNIVEFSSRLWQVHPFREGNTRTTAVFIIKYLRSLNFVVNNDLFKEKSVYFRNALVRSNYYNNTLHIKEDKSYLIRFYENLILNKNNNLQSRDLLVHELFYWNDKNEK